MPGVLTRNSKLYQNLKIYFIKDFCGEQILVKVKDTRADRPQMLAKGAVIELRTEQRW
jgi:hypothetical protein